MSLKFIAISGTTGVTENMYVYEYADDIVVVDCGVGFPEAEMFGVDLVIPDFSYVLANKNKLKGILVTHGHEDHLGALPFLFKEVRAPIYSTKLVAGFIEDKFAEYGVRDARLNIFDPEKDTINLGVFRISAFRVTHSVPDSVAFVLDTPEGRIFHVADYKFDWTPVDDKPFDINKASFLARDGVLALVSDCLGSTSSGYTESEKDIELRIANIVQNAKNQVLFTTISSNISRIQQALNAAKSLRRKVSFIGHSIEAKAEIAKNLGYLKYPGNIIVYPKKLRKMPKEQRLYIISGSYGQSGSALHRVSIGEHDLVRVEAGDVVIFSGDPAPPGTKDNVDFVVDRLIELDCEVHYYDMQENLHVSGHGSQQDITMLAALTKPKYLIPIGGTIRHMRAYRDLMAKMGFDPKRVFEPMSGDVIEFREGEAKVVDKLPTKEVLVDGLGIGDVGNVVLRDRQKLSKDGIAIALIQIDRLGSRIIADPEIISRGFVYHEKMRELLITAGKKLRREFDRKEKVDKRSARDISIDFLEKFFYEATGRRPMILPVVVEV